jgi:hypothetical protein
VRAAFRDRNGLGSFAQERPGQIRVVTAGVAAAVTSGAALWLHHLANLPDSNRLAYALTGALTIGGASYLCGTILGVERFARPLRWFGWVLMSVALVVPSTFSLALPIVAALAVSLRRLPPRRARARKYEAQRA